MSTMRHRAFLFIVRGPWHRVHIRPIQTHNTMLRWSASFLIIAIIAAIFGFGGIAAGAASIAKVLFFLFLILFVLSLLFGGRFTKRI